MRTLALLALAACSHPSSAPPDALPHSPSDSLPSHDYTNCSDDSPRLFSLSWECTRREPHGPCSLLPPNLSSLELGCSSAKLGPHPLEITFLTPDCFLTPPPFPGADTLNSCSFPPAGTLRIHSSSQVTPFEDWSFLAVP